MRYQGQQILVTGGAGFIGSFLVERLLEEGAARVIVFDNFYRGRRENLAACLDRVELIEGDLRDVPAVASAVAGCQTVFHLAAQSQVRTALADPRYCFESNVTGTFNLLEASRAAGISRFIFASSREVYGETLNVAISEDAPLTAKNGYGLSKVAGELYCRQYSADFAVSILRLANVYGPRDYGRVIPIFARQALNGQDLTLLGGKQVCDFIDVGTVVEMFLRIGSSALPGPLNIGSGSPVSLISLAERILAVTGSQASLAYQPQIAAEVAYFVADTRRAQQQLGLVPPADSLAHLPAVVNYLRQHPQ